MIGLVRKQWATAAMLASANSQDKARVCETLERAYVAGIVDRRVSRSGVVRWRLSARAARAIAERHGHEAVTA